MTGPEVPAPAAAGATIDLTNCDREPIHIPGAILPHGALLVVHCDTLAIEQVAGDTLGLLGHGNSALLGMTGEELFSPDQVRRLRDLCGLSELAKPRHLLDPTLRVGPDSPLDASLHRVGERLVLEFERADPDSPHAADPLACVQSMLDGLDRCSDLQSFCQCAAERVRDVAGYDRVMIYRFAEDGSGWVFAESKVEGLSSFLDLHYPASDIPKQARALYKQNWLRLITQVDYTPAPLMPQLNPVTGEPLDMSHALLRDVSPVHRQYLRNMGVDASMSISILHEGELWGLISCHHYTPRRLPRHLRAICELFGSMFSLQLEARQRLDRFEYRTRSREVLQRMLQNLADESDYGRGLINNSPSLLEYVNASGLALRTSDAGGGVSVKVNDGVYSMGRTPSAEQVASMTDWLCRTMDPQAGMFVTDRLGELYAPANAFPDVAAGVLAISVSREPQDFILWFRPEVVETVTWGGDPSKPVEQDGNGERLTPRTSFDAWSEEVRGRSTPWSLSDQDSAFDLRVALLDVVLRRIQANTREREEAFAKQQLLMAELDHRVKNTLANIQALVTQTSHSAKDLAEFAQNLGQRIQAMARVHSLLTKGRWDGVGLHQLVAEELLPHGGRDGRIRLHGRDLMLNSKASLAVSLGLHELTTNAAKYGSLSVPQGSVSVSWECDNRGDLVIEWVEEDGPSVRPPTTLGFGSTLIGRALELETGGRSELDFAPEGVRCRLTLPPLVIVAGATPQATSPEGGGQAAAAAAAPGKRILLVEDSALVIMMIEDMVSDLGWELVGPATRLQDALELARSETVDAALVDVNLNGEMSWPAVEALQSRGIPLALTTGYDGTTILPQSLRETRVISKPFAKGVLNEWLAEVSNRD